MRGAIKASIVLAPLLLLLLGLRACSGGEGERWRERIAVVDPEARLIVDESDFTLIAPSEMWGEHTAGEFREFRTELVARFDDLVGAGEERRSVVVVFSSVGALQKFFGDRQPQRDSSMVHGFTRSDQGAIFLPPTAEFETLRHECVHLIVGQSLKGGTQYSPWVSEGLAQLFQRGLDEPGMPAEMLSGAAAVLRGRTLDLERLLAIEDYGDFTGSEVMRNYLEADLLMTFLFRERPRELLRRYLEAERANSSGRAMQFRRIYRSDEPAFGEDLARFLRPQPG